MGVIVVAVVVTLVEVQQNLPAVGVRTTIRCIIQISCGSPTGLYYTQFPLLFISGLKNTAELVRTTSGGLFRGLLCCIGTLITIGVEYRVVMPRDITVGTKVNGDVQFSTGYSTDRIRVGGANSSFSFPVDSITVTYDNEPHGDANADMYINDNFAMYVRLDNHVARRLDVWLAQNNDAHTIDNEP